uniref:Uncharacterized protein n=1 Tax=Moniliophthora roreri TaxID=221103 RepID=A0A0W0F9I9_MONRR
MIQGVSLEIWAAIFKAAPNSTLVHVCSVSKLFHDIAIPQLYRNVYLRTPRQAVLCCKTLLKKPVAASSVRTFVVEYNIQPPTSGRSSSSHSHLMGFFWLLSRSLNTLKNLTVLHQIAHTNVDHVTPIMNHLFGKDLLFPFLQAALLDVPMSQNVVSFFERHHSSLETVNFNSEKAFSTSHQHPSHPNHFGRLVAFSADAKMVITLLQLCSTPALQRLGKAQSQIFRLLSPFRALRSFHWRISGSMRPRAPRSTLVPILGMDQEYHIVKELRKRHPSLISFCIPYGIEWYCIVASSSDAWIPQTIVLGSDKDYKWLENQLATRMYTALSQLLAHAKTLAGKLPTLPEYIQCFEAAGHLDSEARRGTAVGLMAILMFGGFWWYKGIQKSAQYKYIERKMTEAGIAKIGHVLTPQ